MKKILFSIFFFIPGFLICSFGQYKIQPNKVVPTKKQLEYQQMELIGFFHFNMNTFTNKEWGYGDEDPKQFNPQKLDVGQWARVARDAGMKELILTAKHHDGFCLWPSAFTKHSVKYSPYKNGKGDIVKEFTDACRKYGIKPGLYLSPWDRNNSSYGTPAYIEYYKNQLRELLTNYGKIYEIWLDGANGGDGYYGGARETRKIDSKTYYPWKELAGMIYSLQPQASIFSDAGPDVRWIGNEKGFAGETFWSTINADGLVIGSSDEKYLNTGEPNGKNWLVGVCDVSIRPGWFYHKAEDSLVRPPKNLVDLFYKSVGRNAVLLLNIPPGTDGLVQENDILALKGFRMIMNETFRNNLALKAKVSSPEKSPGYAHYGLQNIVDNNDKSFWCTDNKKNSLIEITLDGIKTFDRILLQEPIHLGQRIASFEIQALQNKEWKTIGSGTTIGYKRILRISPVQSNKIRIVIKESNNTPALSNFGLYKASSKEEE